MTDKLVEMLKERFPPINDTERIHTYGADERIYLNLSDKIFVNSQRFTSYDKIYQIAKQLFDVQFSFEARGDIKDKTIFFEPQFEDLRNLSCSFDNPQVQYRLNYNNHYIQVHSHLQFPSMTISTGNRGAALLFDRQRDLYFSFVERVYEEFLNHAKRQEQTLKE